MKILYHIPSLDTIYAGRPIYYGYKNAFTALGHDFRPLSALDNQKQVFSRYQPDIFITSMGKYIFKYLDMDAFASQKKKGMRVFVNIPQWKSPMSKLRFNEVPSICDNHEYVALIANKQFGDVYYNICEQDDPRMDGFRQTTGYKHHTILLAVDSSIPEPEFNADFASDISYIGTYLPDKRAFMQKHLFPLKEKYTVKIYGRDWTYTDRIVNLTMKAGQYFNIPGLRALKSFKPTLEEERTIHKSSTIALNIHEAYQKFGVGDLNERTFKIPASGGFEVVDNVPSITRYFTDGVDMTIAHSTDEWFEKITYYLTYPEKRMQIIAAGKKNVLKNHTYLNRASQLLSIYNSLT